MSNLRSIDTFRKVERQIVDSSGGPPHDGDMENRLTALETRFDAILPSLATKLDIESVKTEIHKSSGDTHKWMIATVIGLFLGFGGLFLAMSNALKPSTPGLPQAPIVISVPQPPPPAAPIAPK